MNIWKRLVIIFVVVASCVGCDQATKSIVTSHLSTHGIESYFHDFLRIGYTENIGAFLGLGTRLPDELRFVIFVLVVGVFLFGLFIYQISNSKQSVVSLIALSLVFAGGVSNFYDRVMNNGTVVDFLNVGIGPVRTGIFNVADMAILAGIIVLFLASRKRKKDT